MRSEEYNPQPLEETIMSDPTFVHHFGMAVQSDILRQAATDRRGWQAARDDDDDAQRTPTRRLPGIARLAGALRAYPRRAPAQASEARYPWSEQSGLSG
jgi:hypothetical protein